MLKVSAKVFDPLGLLSPFLIRLKIIFQQLCSYRKGWDENLEGEPLHVWKNLVNEFKVLNHIKVPRCYILLSNTVLHSELHGFSDASEKAYAAIVYLKTIYEDGKRVTTSIVASKTRLSCTVIKTHDMYKHLIKWIDADC